MAAKGHTLTLVESLTFLIIVAYKTPALLTEQTKYVNPGETYNPLFI